MWSVTLALPQDVQAEAYDYPVTLFDTHIHKQRRPAPDAAELHSAIEVLQHAHKPLLIVGGGVHYSLATSTLQQFAEQHQIPVAETQAGKGALAWNHPCYVGLLE